MSATPTTREVLEKARELIATPERWTQRVVAARTPCSIFEIQPSDPTATCWCSIGAILAVQGINRYDQDRSGACEAMRRECNWEYLADWNDAEDRTHAEVLEAFDRAIALASTEAGQ